MECLNVTMSSSSSRVDGPLSPRPPRPGVEYTLGSSGAAARDPAAPFEGDTSGLMLTLLLLLLLLPFALLGDVMGDLACRATADTFLPQLLQK